MRKLLKVDSDCLGIVERIKAVDADYFVVYNLDNNKFELHNSGQGRNSYCLTFPYDALDERAYLYVLKTRVQNSDELFERMEAKNAKLQKEQIKQIFNDFKEKLYDS